MIQTVRSIIWAPTLGFTSIMCERKIYTKNLNLISIIIILIREWFQNEPKRFYRLCKNMCTVWIIYFSILFFFGIRNLFVTPLFPPNTWIDLSQFLVAYQMSLIQMDSQTRNAFFISFYSKQDRDSWNILDFLKML